MLKQKTMLYSIVEDLMHVKSNITVAQLLNIPKIRNDLKKAITPKRKRKPKDKEKELEINLATTYSNTPMICKGQIGGWTVDIILDSGSSTSIISKKFLDHLKRKANRQSNRMITGIHGDKKSSLGICDNIAVHIGDVVVSADMEIIDTQAYNLVLGTDWLRKANAVINYKDSQVTISDGSRQAQVTCRNSTQLLLPINDEEEEEDDNIAMALVAGEDETPDQYFYKFTPWGIEIDHETFSWEEYDYMNRQFNPWLSNQKYWHEVKHWFKGPDKECWCQKQLKTNKDECTTCLDEYSHWKMIQVIPHQEVKNAQSFLVADGAEELVQNEYNPIIQDIFQKYPNVIAKDITQLGRTNIVTHQIDTGNAREIKQHYYRMSPKHESFIKEEIVRLQQQGLIVPSHSPWTSPALVVGKANGKLRLVVDYRQLNKVTKPDAYPLPKIADMLDAMAHCKFFSTFDLTSGFWQVRMNAQDQEKTAFSTKFG